MKATQSAKRKRAYPWKFDHDEARRLRIVEGWTYTRLAEHFGVTTTAVQRVCDREFRLKMDKSTYRYSMSGVCAHCGGPRAKYRRRPNGRESLLCRKCDGLARQTRFRFDELGQLAAIRCSGCKRWLQPELFPSSKNISRAKHHYCRECGTKARADYRNRHKVPCTFCGAPCLPPSEKGTRGGHIPRCRACFRKQQAEYMRTPEFREKARAAQRARWVDRPKPVPPPNLCPKGHERGPGRKTCDTCIAEHKARRT